MKEAGPAGDAIRERQGWMRTLAMASGQELEAAWKAWTPRPTVEAVRGPEEGLVMVRSRIDAAGARFNLGEATVTRATMRLHGGPLTTDVVGSAYVLGSDREHARLAAIFDGLLTDKDQRPRVMAEVIEPLQSAQDERDAASRIDARSTLVDFFTVAREHE
ncbi:phosphonate C-P lyase system protein PhnG [Arthrobacter methylotrophus]|uniref:Phosphonate C-P lyase system protein PhnG n=1 Tax=Arthrobacter methylotrophus TaxID=121291 RepID=A0ABV5UMG3_9MICC